MEKYSKGEFNADRFSMQVCDKTVENDISEEFTLPDYQPEIHRLLKVTPSLTPPAQYIGSGTVEFSGNINYNILYCGDDGQLYSASFPSSYSFEAGLDDSTDADLTDDIRALITVTADSIVGRVISKRKTGIRTRLAAHIRAYANVQPAEKIIGSDDADAQRRFTDRGQYADVVRYYEQDIPVGDEIIPEQREGEIRIIGSEGKVFVNQAETDDSVINCKGELVLEVMVCREGDDGIETVVRKLPFSQEIDAPGIDREYECRVWGECQNMNITVDDGRIICDGAVSVEAEAQKKVTFEYTRAIYSTKADSETVFTDKKLTEPVKACNTNFTHSAVFDISEKGIPAGAHIISIEGNAVADNISVDSGRLSLTGEVRYTVLYVDGNEYDTKELAQDFRYETDVPQMKGEIDGDAILTVVNCRARMDGERIAADSEIGVSLRVCCIESIHMPEEVRFGAAKDVKKGDCIVCYPESTDTLWSIASRYLADADEICAVNGIKKDCTPDTKLSELGLKYIII